MLLLTEKEKQEKYQRNMPNRWKDEPNKHWKNQKEIRECAVQEIEDWMKRLKDLTITTQQSRICH